MLKLSFYIGTYQTANIQYAYIRMSANRYNGPALKSTYILKSDGGTEDKTLHRTKLTALYI